MLKLELLEPFEDINSLLTPKRKLLTLAHKVNGSMLAFHKEVKNSTEIEELAESFFKTKIELNKLRNKSASVNHLGLVDKIHKIKNMKVDAVDFI